MKNALGKFLAAAAIIGAAGAMLAATAVEARDKDPVFEMRRTLTMAFGQHRIVLEAPVGMCFFDESQYMENMLVSQMRKVAGKSSSEQVMAMFADCDELEKFVRMPELMADTLPGTEPPQAELTYTGGISWLKPKLGRSPLTLQDYLDMRESGYRDDVIKDISDSYEAMRGKRDLSLGGGLNLSLFAPSPDKYTIDQKAHRSDTGISIGFSAEFEAEYQKRRLSGVIGTTMIRNFPVQISIGANASGDKKPRSLKRMRRTLDELMAQLSTLNP